MINALSEDASFQDELKLLRLMVDGSRDFISLIDRSYVYRAVNASYMSARGIKSDDIVGYSVCDVWGNEVFEDVIRHHLDRCFSGVTVQHRSTFDFREAGPCVMKVTYYPCRNNEGKVTHAVVVNHDITELARKEEELSRLAYFDSLTALPNRTQFTERLALSIASARRLREALAVFFIDLDNFKRINDVHGHAAGDDLLREVARRLQETFRETDTIAQPSRWYRPDDASIHRLGGDEFTLVFPGVKEPRSLEILAQRVNSLFERPFEIAGTELQVSCSVGISVFPDDGRDGDALLKHADLAMYRAKDLGKNRHEFYNPTMSQKLRATTEIETHLRKAIEAGAIEVHYQPKIDPVRNCVVGCEALARWTDPELGEVPPSRFIPVAEEAGLIEELDLLVLARACQDIGGLHHFDFTLSVAVNYSSVHFDRDDLVERTVEILEQTGYPRPLLEIEITESALIEDIEDAVDRLKQLSAGGIVIALDDFGTGFSSLTYLSRLPIGVVKLNRAFTTELDKPGESAIFEGVMTIAAKLGLTVVAEGIETAAQLERVRNVGQPLIQGFLYSRPLPIDDLKAYLSRFIEAGGTVGLSASTSNSADSINR